MEGQVPALDTAMARRLERLAAEAVRECFQCAKCSAGCPVAATADLLPHEAVQALQFGQAERILGSRFLWLCLGCQTCITRCPNRVDIPHAIDQARALALAGGLPVAEVEIVAFHQAFLAAVRRRGRLHELTMIRRYKAATKDYFSDLRLGLRLWRRGKVRLFPSRGAGAADVKALFGRRGGGP